MKVRWQVDDGYAGGSRPHTSLIDDGEIRDCIDLQDALDFIDDCVYEDFQQRIHWGYLDRDKMTREVEQLLKEKENEEG